ncbi:MAG: dienelactone hydrolase family protein [Cyanobacteria bacterium TGS_CYA1]|nr:dienelactone hydrolase family protein [Cyanobacteria bacterium TGS_CYA1]
MNKEIKTYNPLDNLILSYHCPVDWNSMDGNERERFCKQCSKTVFNISDLSRKQANEYLQQRSNEPHCVKFYLRSDGTITTDDCPRIIRPLRNASLKVIERASLFISLIFISICNLLPTHAQPKKVDPSKSPFSMPNPFAAPVASPKAAPTPVAAPITMGRVCPIARTDAPILGQFKSGNKVIHTENFFSPDSKKEKLPVVIIMHGAGGLDEKDGFFRNVAKALAKQNKIVVLVHYMDQSNLKSANYAQIGKNFSLWKKTLERTIDYVKTLPNTDQNDISLLGHSLGAQLSLHTAANRSDIKSVIVMAGCFVLPTDQIKSMPPVLILQGTADKTVTLAREQATLKVLKRVNCPYEEHLLKGVDHSFSQTSMSELEQYFKDFLNR